MIMLEIFDTDEGQVPGSAPLHPSKRSVIEESRLAGYDQGYQAGWDDAAAAQRDETSRIAAEVARHLQALSFTWQEARGHILLALEPLLEAMVSRLLPEIARDSLAPLIRETLIPLAAAQANTPAILRVNPAARRQVEAALAQAPGLILHFQEDSNLGEGQVFIRLGPAETKIDLTRATAEIAAAVRAFFTLEKESQDDGGQDNGRADRQQPIRASAD